MRFRLAIMRFRLACTLILLAGLLAALLTFAGVPSAIGKGERGWPALPSCASSWQPTSISVSCPAGGVRVATVRVGPRRTGLPWHDASSMAVV